MFDKLFAFIRQGVRDAIIGGIEDAHDELANRIEAPPERYIEDVKPTNGRTRKAAAK